MTKNDPAFTDPSDGAQTPHAGPGEEMTSVDQAMSDLGETEADVEGAEAPAQPATKLGPLEQLQLQLREANDRAVRSQAELENFRKRTRREQSEQLQYATLPFIRDLLPVMDNFQRAIDAIQSDESSHGMLEGIAMVADQIRGVLQNHGCEEIPAHGQEFDPMLHEAVLQRHSEEFPAGHVVDVMQVGYRLRDRVVRTSQVVVSQGPPAGA